MWFFLVIGGLLSAHLLAQRAGVKVEEGWPCQGPLLRLAVDAAERLLPGLLLFNLPSFISFYFTFYSPSFIIFDIPYYFIVTN